MTERVLDRRTLNRTLLARQHLLDRVEMPVQAMVEHLVALQAQLPGDPYLALWDRIARFRPEELSALIETRRAVRVPLLRTTIHLVTARDCLALRPVLQPVLERGFSTGSPFGRRLAGMDIGAVVAEGRALLVEEPRTTSALGALLAKRWPDRDATAMSYAVRYLEPLVQVPPRGLWGRSGQPRWTTVERWLGEPVGTDGDPTSAILRYLAAFGPATVNDIQTWSWLTRLRGPLDVLRPRLRTYRDEAGRELFDLPSAAIVDADVPAPVRFLPQYDNVTLSHDDRSRVISDEHRRGLISRPNAWFGTVLVDGTWTIARAAGLATLKLAPLERWTRSVATAVEEEGHRLLGFLEAPAGRRAVEMLPGP